MAIQTSSLMGTAGQSGSLLSMPARSWKAALACGSAAILAVAFAVPALTTEAQAARCPSGQFWRVSKKICQDKSIGVKLGIFKSKKANKTRRKAKAEPPKPAPEPKPVAETAEPEKPAAEKPSPVASAKPETVTENTPVTAGSTTSVLASKTPIIRLKRPVTAALKTPSPAEVQKPAAAAPAPEAVKSGATGSPLNAITAATRPDTSRPTEKPLETRLVKATYFTATPSGLAAQTAPANTETARRAVLNLLKSRLHTHAERNRDTIIRRATAQ
jgi:hypothetical protein